MSFRLYALSRPTITYARTAGFKAVFADRGNKKLLVAMLNLLLPPEAAVKDIVEYHGSVTNVKVLRGVHPSLDAEAVRVVESSPLWTPGVQQGEYVKETYTFPVSFALTEGQSR